MYSVNVRNIHIHVFILRVFDNNNCFGYKVLEILESLSLLK